MIVTRTLLLAALALAFAIPAATATAPMGGWTGFETTTGFAHTFDPARGHEAEVRALGCRVTSTDRSLADRAVIFENGDVKRLTFGQLEGEKSRTWVIGACPTVRKHP